MDKIKEELEKLKQNGNFRIIPNIDGKSDSRLSVNNQNYVNFASNDYLGISTKLDLREEFVNSNKSLLSSASARLLTGTSQEYPELEKTVAKLTNKEKALIFNTGYQCNLGVISALIGKGDIIFSDKLNHASIIDGMRLSEGEFCRYKHFDYENLEKLLQNKRGKYKRALIVTESVFSMDGDIADLDKLVELKKKYNCLLMVDEAHAFCCYNPAILSFKKDVDIITATFGKAVGSFGAFCASNSLIIDYLINKSRSFIFSTSIPPFNISWSNWLLTEKFEYLLEQQKKLENLTENVHKFLKEKSIITPSSTHIIPIIIGDTKDTLNLAEKLKSEGYYIPAIRPPTVPLGTSRLRISLTADCNLEDFKRVIDICQI